MVIRHLPGGTPAEDIPNELLALGHKVHNVRQISTSRQQPEGDRQTQALPLFLITLERNEKSQQIFKHTQLNHIIVQVEAYRARIGLTQCYNASSSGMFGQTASSLHAACGVEDTVIRNVQKRITQTHHLVAAIAS